MNGLAIIFIEKDLVSKLEYKNLINDFASQKARKVNCNWIFEWFTGMYKKMDGLMTNDHKSRCDRIITFQDFSL